MFFSVGSSVFAFPCRGLGGARRRPYIIFFFYSLETLAWCVHMCAQMQVWRPEVNAGGLPPTLSPYSLRWSLTEPGADCLKWLATELCDPSVSTPAALTSWAISLVPCTPCFGLRFVLLLIMCIGGICIWECSTHMGQKRALCYLQQELQWPMSWKDPDPLREQ